MSQRKLF